MATSRRIVRPRVRSSPRPRAKTTAQKQQKRQTSPTPRQAFLALKNLSAAYRASLARMSYADFLATDYWQIVRAYILVRQHVQCALCTARQGVQVHHRHYRNPHGSEHLHPGDLIGLCRACHARHHGKENR